MNDVTVRCGYVGLLGRPNVGKSTLLNRLVGQKLSITAPKPQTTRHAIVGITTTDSVQAVFVDTPGIHGGGRRALNRYLNRAAAGTLSYANVVVFLIHAGSWTDDDQQVLDRLKDFKGAVIAAVNKVDLVRDKSVLLPFLQELSKRRAFHEIVPISATGGLGVDILERSIGGALPESPFRFPEDQVTTVSQRFLASEFIREKLTRLLHDELPYALTVDVERFQMSGDVTHIDATIWVERDSQKGIVIGRGGSLLREAGQQARMELERELQHKVHLRTWVKVRSGWSDDARALQSLGYRTDLD